MKLIRTRPSKAETKRDAVRAALALRRIRRRMPIAEKLAGSPLLRPY